MEDLLNPANIIVLAVIAVGMFFGLRRIVASTRGKSCCSDGSSGKKVKKGRGGRYRQISLPLLR